MPDLSKGKIFPAAERGHTETSRFRSYHTFSCGSYRNEAKQPFGPLYLLNDDTLAGGQSLTLPVEEETDLILLPVVGALVYRDSLGNECCIRAGEAQHYALRQGVTAEIINPYEEALVNFLQFRVRSSAFAASVPGVISFDIEKNRNKLLQLFTGVQQINNNRACKRICIGKFDGRKEAAYQLSDPRNGVFVFVVQGAFEVQHRLIETRDGLALWELQEIEMEALSNHAIILLLEIVLDEEHDTLHPKAG
jgi:redox-sensitive bicupin YhaK (pirin superfamily)